MVLRASVLTENGMVLRASVLTANLQMTIEQVVIGRLAAQHGDNWSDTDLKLVYTSQVSAGNGRREGGALVLVSGDLSHCIPITKPMDLYIHAYNIIQTGG